MPAFASVVDFIRVRAVSIVLPILLLLSVVLPSYYVFHAYEVNGTHGFPLDDSYITLQFARNFSQYGVFSYFGADHLTAGATSPMYVVALAAGLRLYKDGVMLSYALGIVAFALSVWLMYLIGRQLYGGVGLALMASAFLVLDPWMNFFAVMGMETMFYIAVLLSCFYFYRTRNATLLGLMLGIGFWTRPDAVVLICALALDHSALAFLKWKYPERPTGEALFSLRALSLAVGISAMVIGLALLLNYSLSGTLMTNTFSAKMAFLGTDRSIAAAVSTVGMYVQRLSNPAYYLSGALLVFALLGIARNLFARRYSRHVAAALFVVGFTVLYAWEIPTSPPFGRYLIPVIPFLILLSVYGLREMMCVVRWAWPAGGRLVKYLVVVYVAVALLVYALANSQSAKVYASGADFITSRQVATAKWLEEKTSGDAVIATHDVGALAYFSDRKIVDVMGLVSPEFIPILGKKEYLSEMNTMLAAQGVTHVAFLQDWFRVANQHPLFSAGEDPIYAMHVYEYVPGGTHILRGKPDINDLLRKVSRGEYSAAAVDLGVFIEAHPDDPDAHYWLAVVRLAQGDREEAKGELRKALAIYPEYPEAAIKLADLLATDGDIAGVREAIAPYMVMHPNDRVPLELIDAAKRNAL